MKRNWSKMLDNITRRIARKLLFYPHYCKFAASCSDWYKITKEVHGPFRDDLVSLVLPYNNKTGTCAMYQISGLETYELSLPQLRDKDLYGCSNGWLIVGDNNFGISLINLMTQQQVELPVPYDTIELSKSFLGEDYLRYGHPIKKIILLESPSSSMGCRVAAIMSVLVVLHVCQLGDNSWYDPINRRCGPEIIEMSCFLNDLLFFRGKLYAIDNGKNILILDFYGPNYNTRLIRGPVYKHPSIGRCTSLSHLKTYLVECFGNLLVVQKLIKFSRGVETYYFHMYQFDEYKEKWSRIYGLKDKSLFLGMNESFSVIAAEIRGCRPNCIYFADDSNWLQMDSGYHNDNGVFSCDDGTVQMFNISHSFAQSMPAVWCQQKF